jgi:hypothetical protein
LTVEGSKWKVKSAKNGSLTRLCRPGADRDAKDRDAVNRSGNALRGWMRRAEANAAPGEERSATDWVSVTFLRSERGCI